MEDQIPDSRKKKRERSPGYPGIDLEQAIEKARVLYRQEKRNFAPVSTIMEHWGYKSKSGPGAIAIAALKKFGLITDEGTGDNRKAKLSEEAFNIIVDERKDSSDRLRVIQQAARKPAIHAELWEKYRANLPSDPTLKYELRQRGFTDSAADEFIEEYKRTLKFSELAKCDMLSEGGEDKTSGEGAPIMDIGSSAAAAAEESGCQTFQLPLSPKKVAVIQLPSHMDEKAWKRMLTILDAMKPGIVGEDDSQD